MSIQKRMEKIGRNLDIADCINETCPWSGKPVRADSLTEYKNYIVGFCNPGCRDKFDSAVREFEEILRR
ncbi:MAG: glutathione S-transferase [Gammaproteobacteria bacterium]|nr:glutathione S-transferase [Gammaproteobacteria bacterium]